MNIEEGSLEKLGITKLLVRGRGEIVVCGMRSINT
jgi:hypothetical protein